MPKKADLGVSESKGEHGKTRAQSRDEVRETHTRQRSKEPVLCLLRNAAAFRHKCSEGGRTREASMQGAASERDAYPFAQAVITHNY